MECPKRVTFVPRVVTFGCATSGPGQINKERFHEHVTSHLRSCRGHSTPFVELNGCGSRTSRGTRQYLDGPSSGGAVLLHPHLGTGSRRSGEHVFKFLFRSGRGSPGDLGWRWPFYKSHVACTVMRPLCIHYEPFSSSLLPVRLQTMNMLGWQTRVRHESAMLKNFSRLGGLS